MSLDSWAEVERLIQEVKKGEKPMPCKACEHSMAQVSVLIKHLRHWWAGGPLPSYLEQAIQDTSAEARALLDRLHALEVSVNLLQEANMRWCESALGNRLQRAEEVVKAYRVLETHLIDHHCDNDMCDVALELGNARSKALAAWEERKA